MTNFLTTNMIPLNPYLMLYIAIAILILLFIWIVRLEMKIKRLLGGGSARTLEEAIKSMREDVKDFVQFQNDIESYLKTVEKRLKRSIQSIETVRFNPFKGNGSGSNQSFATALIDERGNGIVISSLYGRERVSVFAKPIKEHRPQFELSDEERESLEKAGKSLTMH
jgi:hypothetical protein